MPLFSRRPGMTAGEFGNALSIAVGNWTMAESFAQFATTPASYYYRAGVEPAPNAQRLIEQAYQMAAFAETNAMADAVRLQEAKPQARELANLHRFGTGFFLNMAQSLADHNRAAVAEMQGQGRDAAKHARSAMNFEGVAFRTVEPFKDALVALRDTRPALYLELGLEDEEVARFNDKLWAFIPLVGRTSIWSAST